MTWLIYQRSFLPRLRRRDPWLLHGFPATLNVMVIQTRANHTLLFLKPQLYCTSFWDFYTQSRLYPGKYEKHGWLLYWPGHAKTCLKPYANNKGADQPAHPRSLISTFVVRCLDSMIYMYTCYIQRFKILASFCS